MSDTTPEDPAHFAPLDDGYDHTLSPGCSCHPERVHVDDYEGMAWFVLHRIGGPGGPVHQIPRAPGYGEAHE